MRCVIQKCAARVASVLLLATPLLSHSAQSSFMRYLTQQMNPDTINAQLNTLPEIYKKSLTLGQSVPVMTPTSSKGQDTSDPCRLNRDWKAELQQLDANSTQYKGLIAQQMRCIKQKIGTINKGLLPGMPKIPQGIPGLESFKMPEFSMPGFSDITQKLGTKIPKNPLGTSSTILPSR